MISTWCSNQMLLNKSNYRKWGGAYLTKSILPLGLNREGVLFETGGLLNRLYSIFLIRKSQIIHHNNTSISSSPSMSSSISILVGVTLAISPKIATNGFPSGLKNWIWTSSSPSSVVVNAQDLNDFRMVSHEISFHARSIHSTMTFRGGGFITTFCNLVCFYCFRSVVTWNIRWNTYNTIVFTL